MQNMKTYYVYLLASSKDGTIYTGFTNNLLRRILEHKQKHRKVFTKKYNVFKLVWYIQTENVRSAIIKEKQIKKWNRDWKIREINKHNPEWKDLFYEIGG